MRPRPFLLLIAGFVLVLMAAENVQAEYRLVELANFEGQFAPDPDQDEGTVLDAAENILDDPTQIGAVVQNISWVEYTHHFLLPPGATVLRITITVDYTHLVEPEEGPAGSLDLTFRTPDGDEFCRDERDPPCFEIVYFGGGEKEIDGYSSLLSPVPGEWTITISGSGFDGLLGQVYSGTYELVVLAELLVNSPPIATIDSISPSPAWVDEEVTFSGSGSDSDGTVVAYEWKSAIDGYLSAEANFSSSVLSPGHHNITFRVQDNYGEWSDWDTLTLVVNPNTPPDGIIDSISPSPAKFDEEVTFSGSSSDSDGTVAAHLWESSIDGNLSTEEDFSSSDLSLGTHTITFRVQDNDGAWSDAASASLFVGIAPIPKAGIDVEVEPNTEVQFIGSGTDEDGTIVKYEWDLNGDGVYDWSSALNGITTNIYNSEGTYTTVLRVTDDDGLTATDSRVITVSKAGDGGGGNDDDGGGIPAPSLAASVAAVAVIALRRRR